MEALMTVVPIAHAGHWAVYFIYAVPVVVVLSSIVFTTVRERRVRRAVTHSPKP